MTLDPDSRADLEAMQRLKQGDDLALNELMNRWQQPLVAFLYRQTGNHQEAVDLAQETFVRVYENRLRYQPGARFSTWLFTIANNLCRNLFRWHSRHPSTSLIGPDEIDLHEKIASDSATPFDSADSSELAAAIRTAIQGLPHDLRTVVLLFEYEEMSYQEIATIAGCSPKAVETRLYRARQLLREKLDHALISQGFRVHAVYHHHELSYPDIRSRHAVCWRLLFHGRLGRAEDLSAEDVRHLR